MNEQAETPGSSGASGGGGRLPTWVTVAAPAVALVIGLALGALLTSGNSDSGEADDSPTQSESGPASPSEGDVAVVVPHECRDAAETVQEATDLIRENVSSFRNFRTKDIVDLLNQLEDLDQQARDQARACSQVETTTVSPSAEESDSASPSS